MMFHIALGDSISISDYPDQELGTKGNGAAALFSCALFDAGLVFTDLNLTRDGATCEEIKEHQLAGAKKILSPRCEAIITLTAGGNDISFRSMRLKTQKPTGNEFNCMMNSVLRDYSDLVCAIRKAFPNSMLMLNTLYDPTDGTGKLPENCGLWAEIAPMYSAGRRTLGKYIFSWGNRLGFASVTDIFTLFDGKGMKIGNSEGYYYDKFLIEPGAVGARVIADAWMHTLKSHLAHKPEDRNDDRIHQASSGSTGVRKVRGRGDQASG
jgi:hypothetical protein